MKKIIITLTILSFACVTAACTQWNEHYDNMPDEFKEEYTMKVKENQTLLNENPQNAEAAFEVAFAYDQLGRYKKAERYYKKTLKLDPSNYVVWNNLATLYEKVERYDLAAGAVKELFQFTPDSTETADDAVRIMLKAGQVENAELALDYYMGELDEEKKAEMRSFISELYQRIYDYKNSQ